LNQLAWNLPEYLLGEHVRIPCVLQEWNELDTVSGLVGLRGLGEQWCVIGIQGLHTREVSTADTDNDDGQRQARSCDDGIDRSLHVHDGTIGKNQQNGVVLAVLRHLLRLLKAETIDIAKNWGEISGPVQRHSLNCMPIDV